MLKDEYTAVNIRDYLLDNHSEIAGEQILINLFSGFSCPLNPNVEKFLKENAIHFTKKNQSVTYLVFSEKTATLVGYFTLAIKPITVNSTVLSNTIRRKLLRVGKISADKQELYLSAYLIAQPKLRQFYVEENDFKEFGIRKDEETLVQMLKLL